MFTLGDVYRAVGRPPPAGADAMRIEAAHYDSRRIGPNMLFVALPGERVDGNDFIADAFARGAMAALCGRLETDAPTERQVVTPNALAAYQRLGAELRSRSRATFVAVTGSNGKTTTKQALAAALHAMAPTLATDRSENTDIGIPTTLSRLRPDQRFAVIEMGAQVRGEIEAYCAYARPDVGVITNIAGAHLGLFSSLDAVATAKAELLAGLPEGGPVMLNADDDRTPWLRERARGPVTTFGRHAASDVRVLGSVLADGSGTRVRATIGDRAIELHAAGAAGAIDLAFGAALATCVALGLDLNAAAEGLAGFRAPPHRLQLVRLPNGALMLDDSYNANHASMLVALDVLRDVPAPGRRVAVLGDMFELGEFAIQEHRATGRHAAFVDLLVCVGSLARHIHEGALAAGLNARASWLIEIDTDMPDAISTACGEAASRLRDELGTGDAVLLKASNGMGFATIVEALAGRPPGAPAEATTPVRKGMPPA